MPGSVRLAALISLLFISACQTASGPPTARLSAIGPEVRVNGAAARNGMSIEQGDRIGTGKDSSARIVWSDGTRLQLDESSDPLVKWDGSVLFVNVGYGWFLFDTGQMDVRIVNELADVVAHSRGAIHVLPGSRFDVYLLSGAIDLNRPQGQGLTSGQKLSIGRNGSLTYGTITPAERAAIEQRFGRWTFASAVQPPYGIGNIGFTIGIGTGGGYGHKRQPQNPTETPAGNQDAR